MSGFLWVNFFFFLEGVSYSSFPGLYDFGSKIVDRITGVIGLSEGKELLVAISITIEGESRSFESGSIATRSSWIR